MPANTVNAAHQVLIKQRTQKAIMLSLSYMWPIVYYIETDDLLRCFWIPCLSNYKWWRVLKLFHHRHCTSLSIVSSVHIPMVMEKVYITVKHTEKYFASIPSIWWDVGNHGRARRVCAIFKHRCCSWYLVVSADSLVSAPDAHTYRWKGVWWL